MPTPTVDIFMRLPYPTLSGNNQYKQDRHGNVRLKQEIISYRNAVHGLCYGLGLSAMKVEGPVWVEYQLHPPGPGRRDSENTLKVLKDAITKAGVWADDSNIVIPLEVIHWKRPRVGGLVDVWIRTYEGEPEGDEEAWEGVEYPGAVLAPPEPDPGPPWAGLERR